MVDDGTINVYGGVSSGYKSDIWKYDIHTGIWTWIGGDKVANQLPVYGKLGIEDVTNSPGGRSAACTWTGSDGSMCLLGGYTDDGTVGDLWKYNPETSAWTWMRGSKKPKCNGIYRAITQPSQDNMPGARSRASVWQTRDGCMWLFGGLLSIFYTTP